MTYKQAYKRRPPQQKHQTYLRYQSNLKLKMAKLNEKLSTLERDVSKFIEFAERKGEDTSFNAIKKTFLNANSSLFSELKTDISVKEVFYEEEDSDFKHTSDSAVRDTLEEINFKISSMSQQKSSMEALLTQRESRRTALAKNHIAMMKKVWDENQEYQKVATKRQATEAGLEVQEAIRKKTTPSKPVTHAKPVMSNPPVISDATPVDVSPVIITAESSTSSANSNSLFGMFS
jgi:hypothetical protein